MCALGYDKQQSCWPCPTAVIEPCKPNRFLEFSVRELVLDVQYKYNTSTVHFSIVWTVHTMGSCPWACLPSKHTRYERVQYQPCVYINQDSSSHPLSLRETNYGLMSDMFSLFPGQFQSGRLIFLPQGFPQTFRACFVPSFCPAWRLLRWRNPSPAELLLGFFPSILHCTTKA